VVSNSRKRRPSGRLMSQPFVPGRRAKQWVVSGRPPAHRGIAIGFGSTVWADGLLWAPPAVVSQSRARLTGPTGAPSVWPILHQ
jgi:hypothetical protein